jgi:hypothetical protein
MKHQIVRALQKYVLNPPVKLLFALGIVPRVRLLVQVGSWERAGKGRVGEPKGLWGKAFA